MMRFESILTILTIAAAALTLFIIILVLIDAYATIKLLKDGRKY